MQSLASKKTQLQKTVTCPYCWETWPAENVLWIAEHQDLIGDVRLGAEQRLRFLPTRFSVDCNALDPRGFECSQLACPNCHLVLPRQLFESPSFFVSILGAPSSGKSYLLTSMTWQMRMRLPDKFALSFTDADPTLNQNLIDNEASLFLNSDQDKLTSLADLIAKTALEGDLYDEVNFGDQTVKYVRPFMFHIRPEESHPNYSESKTNGTVLCMYDNAGEHFQLGMDSTGAPVTRHLALSEFLMFVFDPTQDPRFRAAVQKVGGTRLLTPKRDYRPQAPVLQEAAVRVRRYANLPQSAKHDRPLFVILSKFDQWSDILSKAPLSEPWAQMPEDPIRALHFETIEQRSNVLRDLLKKVCPELVGTAEAFADDVTYFPASALGWKCEGDAATGQIMVRPGEIKPFGVTIPLLYGIAKRKSGLVFGLRKRNSAADH